MAISIYLTSECQKRKEVCKITHFCQVRNRKSAGKNRIQKVSGCNIFCEMVRLLLGYSTYTEIVRIA